MCLSELHLFEHPEPLSAAMNMALDEALLETAAAPSLRFYRWKTEALSFGYSGSYSDVAAEAGRRDIVRRWTGGGIVFHGADLTYSVVLPRLNDCDPMSSRAAYTMIHAAIRDALCEKIAASLAMENAPKISDACFANPVVADVLIDGRKIAGAAHRRTRAGLLHQGSIQYEQLPDSFKEAFATVLCSRFERKPLAPDLAERAQAIARGKYATEGWLRRR